MGSVDRTDDFRPDPDLQDGLRAELSDYRGSGFDRGHLVPAADMKRSLETMSESFLLSNMAPQKPGFNRGIWKVLEGKVRALAGEKKNIYVMTGALYLTGDSDSIGDNHVAVPSHFYKILIAGDRNNPAGLEAVAFIIPNDSFPSDELNSFIVTINKVEEESGLDFLHDLDDSIEGVVESEGLLAQWFEE